jgi:hypothetical protein
MSRTRAPFVDCGCTAILPGAAWVASPALLRIELEYVGVGSHYQFASG